jgi:hypothetical protein
VKNRLCQLEFGVACMRDVRSLLKVWQRVLALEGLTTWTNSPPTN